MKQRTNGVPRAKNSGNFQREGPNWVLLAGGALLSTLSIRLGYKLKQALDTKQQENASNGLESVFFISVALGIFLPAANVESHSTSGNGKYADRNKAGVCPLHANAYSFNREDTGCFNCISGMRNFFSLNRHLFLAK